ncbi:hypothetical protein [Nocardiopsis protaetiae]
MSNQFAHGSADVVVQIGAVYGDVHLGGHEDEAGGAYEMEEEA